MKSINNGIRYVLILTFCFFIPATTIAGTTTKKATVVKHPLVLQTDTSAVKAHQFDEKKMRGFVNDKELQYDKSNVPGQSIWTLFWRWVWDHLFKNVFNSSESNSFFYYLFLSLGVIFIAFILFRITGINAIQIIRRDSKVVTVPYTESLENIHELDFDSEIDKAIATNNYRLAVRLLYLNSLKHLSDTGLINWQLEKTNTAYIYELPDGKKRQVFSLLTYQFEYVWYGNFYIDANSFQNISSLFQQFKQAA
ncbi:MAG TPA: hypothetical protein VK668_04990 [Mucilaginibacter sp.]|nr:hypothetical protein [Mucilaginibacter sp.]